VTEDSFDLPQILAGQGRAASAEYLEQEISGYQGNPFIEALPRIMTEDEAIEALARYPPYDEGEREMPAHLRLHAIQNALQFFAPLPVHVDLEQRFSRMMRSGYQMRNPVARGFWRDLDDRSKAVSASTNLVPNCARSLTLGFTIIGFPGVGKSTSVEAVLSLYPQVIYHGRYKGRDFNVAQVVWLKLECPHDGSIKGLCLNFFQAIDNLLGTKYEHNYAGGRRTTDDLLPKMARVAAIHGIGVLVIDEIQRLSWAKSGGAGKMLNFFVQLTNSIGVPVVLVGTYKARSVLSGEFHQIRRGTGQGDLVWDRMEEGEWVEEKRDGEAGGEGSVGNQKIGIWQLFLESLWPYQYVRVPCALTKELSHVLYQETQGITDFAAKVYMLAQVRAITTAARPEDEVITADVIRSVARDSLKQAQPVLVALRRGDTQYLSTVPDVNPIAIDDFIRLAKGGVRGDNSDGLSDEASSDGDLPPVVMPYGEARRPGDDDSRAAPRPKRGRGPRRPKKGGGTAYPEGDLRASVVEGGQVGTTFEALRQAGHTSSATEYIGADEATA
jgi:hypothetical protein